MLRSHGMRPSAKDLFKDLESDTRLRLRDRHRLVRIRRDRSRPLLVTWMLDLAAFTGLYIVGYAGAFSYWATLRWIWDEAWVLMFLPTGHAIPALIAGVYMGILYSRGRFFFLVGPVLLVAATFVREVMIPWGGLAAFDEPWWMVWIACGEGLIAGGLAMALGAWAGAKGHY